MAWLYAGGILGGSVPDHLLVNYRKALVAICLAQFNTRKGFEGGGQVLQNSSSTCCPCFALFAAFNALVAARTTLFYMQLCLAALTATVTARSIATHASLPLFCIKLFIV